MHIACPKPARPELARSPALVASLVFAVSTHGRFPGDASRRGLLLPPVLFSDDVEDGTLRLWSGQLD